MAARHLVRHGGEAPLHTGAVSGEGAEQSVRLMEQMEQLTPRASEQQLDGQTQRAVPRTHTRARQHESAEAARDSRGSREEQALAVQAPSVRAHSARSAHGAWSHNTAHAAAGSCADAQPEAATLPAARAPRYMSSLQIYRGNTARAIEMFRREQLSADEEQTQTGGDMTGTGDANGADDMPSDVGGMDHDAHNASTFPPSAPGTYGGYRWWL
ncbi:MAG: hypothetical protein EOO41_05790 [Methanobacteriota archaeon]|nr:MAG: hypothetical protein EOO41_05790 [Euryarchaeota archaeon]